MDGTKACNIADDPVELPDIELTVLLAVEGVDSVASTGNSSAVKVNSRAVELRLRHCNAAGTLWSFKDGSLCTVEQEGGPPIAM
jgi:hypothetical protein